VDSGSLEEIEDVVIKVLDKDPLKRYFNGAELIAALEEAVVMSARTIKPTPALRMNPAGVTQPVAPKPIPASEPPTLVDTTSRPTAQSMPTPATKPLTKEQLRRTPFGLILIGLIILALVAGGVFLPSTNLVAEVMRRRLKPQAVAVVDNTTEELPLRRTSESHWGTVTTAHVVLRPQAQTDEATEPTSAAPSEQLSRVIRPNLHRNRHRTARFHRRPCTTNTSAPVVPGEITSHLR
jgi:hypothetical protein